MDDLLHCPKCQEQFGEGNRQPKLLQCHHTYCLKCVQELQTRQGRSKKSSKSVTCPTCSKVTSLGKKGASSLQDNFYITTFRSTLDMQASETESVVDDIYVSEDEADDDQLSPVVPPEDANDWCKTCRRVALPSCEASKHVTCNLLKMIRGLLAQFGDMVLSQMETREPVLHALQSAELALFGVLHGLQEDISSQDMLLSMARSEKEWLLAIDLTNKTTSTLADRFGKLDLQMSAAAGQLERARTTANNFLGLQKAILNVDFGIGDEEPCSVTLEMDGNTDNEKALRYVLYKMMQAKKLNVPDVKPDKVMDANVEEWNVVGSDKTLQKVSAETPQVQASSATKTGNNLHPAMNLLPANAVTGLPAAFSSTAQRVGVQTVDKAVPATARLPPNGTRHLRGVSQPAVSHSVPSDIPVEPRTTQQLVRHRENSVASVKSIAPSTHKHHCFFEIEVNGKSIGTVVMKLRPDVAPKMCSNFVALCTGELGFGYKGSKIFKVHPNSFVVGGDFQNNDGSGGYSIFGKGYFLGDDCKLQDTCGAIRMRGLGTDIKTGGGKVGSQFHIWVGDKDFKEFKKTLVFGHVVKGLELLQYISNFKTIRNGYGEHVVKSSIVISNCGLL